MSVSTSVGAERPGAARHSIRASFALRVALPAGCLAVLWLLALAVALRTALAGRSVAHSHAILISYGLLGVAGLVAIAVAVVLTGSFGRRLSRDLTALAAAAEQLAGRPVATRTGRLPDPRADAAILAAATATTEIAQAAAAIASLQHTALAAATASEAGLRDGLRQVFVSLARRNQSLLQRQLRLIDALEQKATDPAALADLFALDHLTTRMRRHAESLAILSGAAPGRSWTRAGTGHRRHPRQRWPRSRTTGGSRVLTTAEDAVAGPAVADMIHLLAELIENATLFSPSGTRVEVRAERVANGFAIEIDDRGLGIEPGQLDEINQQLASPPDFDLANADRLGLFVGAKLAARHGVRVSLRPSPYGGTTAIVLMPNSIVVLAAHGGTASDGALPAARPAVGRSARLDLRDGAALALTGPRLRSYRARAQMPSPPLQLRPALDRAPASRAAPRPARRRAWTVHGDLPAAGPSRHRPGAARLPGRRRLPRPARAAIRQAELVPAPAGEPVTAACGTRRTAGPLRPCRPDARTPEQARDLASSLQSGWQRGRRRPSGPASGRQPGRAGEPRPQTRPRTAADRRRDFRQEARRDTRPVPDAQERGGLMS